MRPRSTRAPRCGLPVFVLAALLPFVCTAQQPSAPADSSRAADGSTARMSAAEITALADSIAPVVEKLRGHPFKSRVPVQVVDDSTARRQFAHRAEKFWPAEQIRAEQLVCTQLGLLEPGTDLRALFYDILEEQAGGYYDPERDTFFVLGDMPRVLAPVIMAHELTHALDDQYWDIDALLEQARDDDDRGTALGGVIEGSGTLVMTAYMMREMQAGRLGLEALQAVQQSEAGRAEKLGAAPAFLQRMLLGSYILGQSFLLRGDPLAVARDANVADLDRAFRDPPASSEQVLHPEKYWDEEQRDLPLSVPDLDLSRELGDGWTREAQGNLGEILLAVLAGAGAVDLGSLSLELLLPASWTNAAAAGWGGDRWQLYSNGERHVTVLATRWDREADAREFEKALAPAWRRRIWRRADAVVLVAGDAASRASKLADTYLRALAASKRQGGAGR